MFFNYFFIEIIALFLLISSAITFSEETNSTSSESFSIKINNVDSRILHKKLNISKSFKKFPNIETLVRAADFGDNLYDSSPALFGDFSKHPCRRICQRGQSMSCYYRFVVHDYQRLGPECQRCLYDDGACEAEQCLYGDGIPNDVVAINGQVPGPRFELCEEDTVTIDVLNYLTEELTLHWHGVKMTRSPEMDGAPFITQYPIQPGEIYRYTFPMERRSGTLWYHSQVGWQRALGAAGAMIVRQTSATNSHSRLYDYDLIQHTLMLQDVFYRYDLQKPSNILINGKGRNHHSSLPDNDSSHRYEELLVTAGKRYRLRVINNGIFNCPLEFSVENHRMLVVSTDGNDIEPIQVDSFYLSAGERFDFILNANEYPGSYWIKVRGYNDCNLAQKPLYQGAILQYRAARLKQSPLDTHLLNENIFVKSNESNYSDGGNQTIHLNEINESENELNARQLKDTSKVTNIPSTGLKSLTRPAWPRYTKFSTYYMEFNQGPVDTQGHLRYQIDDISFYAPEVSLLQGRHLYTDDYFYCNASAFMAAGSNCQSNHCECTNVIRLPAYKPIEFVMVNYLDTSLPVHLHGYTVRLIGQGIVNSVGELRRVSAIGNFINLDDLL